MIRLPAAASDASASASVTPSIIGVSSWSFFIAFELLSSGTVLEGAQLTIDTVPAHGVCGACGAETTISWFPLQCSRCGGLDMELLSGEELLVDALELEEEMTTEGIAYGC